MFSLRVLQVSLVISLAMASGAEEGQEAKPKQKFFGIFNRNPKSKEEPKPQPQEKNESKLTPVPGRPPTAPKLQPQNPVAPVETEAMAEEGKRAGNTGPVGEPKGNEKKDR